MRGPTFRSRSVQRTSAPRSASANSSPAPRFGSGIIIESINTPANDIEVQIRGDSILSILGDFSNLGVNILNQRMNILGQDFSLRDLMNTTTITLNTLRLQILALIQTRFFNGSNIREDTMIQVSKKLVYK